MVVTVVVVVATVVQNVETNEGTVVVVVAVAVAVVDVAVVDVAGGVRILACDYYYLNHPRQTVPGADLEVAVVVAAVEIAVHTHSVHVHFVVEVAVAVVEIVVHKHSVHVHFAAHFGVELVAAAAAVEIVVRRHSVHEHFAVHFVMELVVVADVVVVVVVAAVEIAVHRHLVHAHFAMELVVVVVKTIEMRELDASDRHWNIVPELLLVVAVVAVVVVAVVVVVVAVVVERWVERVPLNANDWNHEYGSSSQSLPVESVDFHFHCPNDSNDFGEKQDHCGSSWENNGIVEYRENFVDALLVLAGVAAVATTEPALAIVAFAIHGTVPVPVVVATCCGVPPAQNRATPLSTILAFFFNVPLS
eukprot:scaffold13577_cov48-Attheya_sp.AAC.1